MPEADDLVNEYLNNDKVKIIHILYDLDQVYTCSQWSDNTNSDIDPNGLWPFIATDSSDEYLKKRRAAISKAMKKEDINMSELEKAVMETAKQHMQKPTKRFKDITI